MDRDHRRWRDLVLCHEDLEESERVKTDAHLVACAECRGLLERLHAIERSEPPRGMLPPLGCAASALPAQLRADADRSLRALRARLALPEWQSSVRDGSGPRLGARRLSWRGTRAARAALPLALAAGLALVVFVSRQGPDGNVVRGLHVRPWSSDRGGVDTTAARLDDAWHTGDAFVLAFDLARAAHPVVFHCGPAGEVDLLHPADATVPVPRLPAGRGLQIPLAGGTEVWALEGAPGVETFIIAAAAVPNPHLEAVLADARALAGNGSREDRVAALRELLTARLGPVQIVELEHRR